MNPVLLDQQSLFSFGIAVILAMTGAFAGGYFFGYQQVGSQSSVELDRTTSRALPRLTRADLSSLESLGSRLQPFTVAAGVDTLDPDQQSAAAEHRAAKEPAAAISAANPAEQAPERSDSAVPPPRTSSQQQHAALANGLDSSVAASSAQVIDPAAAQSPHQTDAGQQPTESVASSGRAGIIDTSTADEARYTVQVGVFADPGNAERRKAQLDGLQLTAYVYEYTNQRDQPRYSVRFGYFKDNASARAALTRFEQDMSGSGYVTRIRHN